MSLGGKRINALETIKEQISAILDDYIAFCAVACLLIRDYPVYAVNQRLLDTLGYETEANFIAATKGSFTTCVFPGDVDTRLRAMRTGLKRKGCFSVTYRLKKRDGSYLWVTERGKAVMLPDGCEIIVGAFSDDVLLHDEQTRDLETARAEAERANAAKTEFLSRMSHDMRTPLNGIIGLTELALQETNFASARDYLAQIALSGNFLLGLVNDVLDVAKIESGKMELQTNPLSQSEFLSHVRAVILPLCEEKGLKFNIVEEPDPIIIQADRLRLQQIFINLLSNAVKYTPAGGQVHLKIIRFAAGRDNLVGIRFVVSDNGAGMEAQFLKRAFDAFSCEETGMQATTPGTGLGLFIVNTLISMMKGTIKIESSRDAGTRVVVHLIFPIAENERKPDIQEARLDDLADKRVLLAEDNDINAIVVTELLTKKGVLVERAENGQEALDIFMEHESGYFDLILMDMRMPVMDGIKATRAIRQLTRPDARTIPIVAVTANSFEDDIRACAKAGMNAHLSKPIEPDKLFLAVARGISCLVPMLPSDARAAS